jgi:hypothetical protein
MRVRRKLQKNHMTRPKKSAGKRRRRRLEQRRRLVALGMSEEAVQKLNTRELLDKLKYPKKVQLECAAQ